MSDTPKKPDFSNVQGGHDRAPTKPKSATPDFSNVSGGFQSDSKPVQEKAVATSTYTVARGDSLSKISRKIYGSSKHWRMIFEANRDQIDNPDLIHPGQELRIPPPPDDK